MRIKQLHPDTQWMQVWKNLHKLWVSEEIASMWYIVVHDIVPTYERLHPIRFVESDRCGHCGNRRTPADGMQRRDGHLVVDKGKSRAAFPPTGVYGPISNSSRHSDIKRYCGYWHIS